MSKNPITCVMDDKLPEIVKKMNHYNIERIPIVDESNHLVGIIVMKDVIRTIAKVFEENE